MRTSTVLLCVAFAATFTVPAWSDGNETPAGCVVATDSSIWVSQTGSSSSYGQKVMLAASLSPVIPCGRSVTFFANDRPLGSAAAQLVSGG